MDPILPNNTTTVADHSIPGMAIRCPDVGGDWSLVVSCVERQEDWNVYRKAEVGEPMSLGSALHYHGEFHRVCDEERVGERWVYRAQPWPDGVAFGRIVELTPDAVVRKRAEQARFERMIRLNERSQWYEFVFGFLPARIQESLADRWEFSPEEASRKSAFLELIGAFCATCLSMAFMFASGGGLGLTWALLILLLGAYARWGHAVASGEPIGMWLLEGLDRLSRLCPRRRK